MKPVILYLVDDKEEARWANVPALQKLLDAPDVEVVGLVPFQTFAEYDPVLANPQVRGFLIDQRMRGGGVVNYNGIDLAEYLRGHYRKLPIYILTGYPKDDFSGTEYRVEDIVDKEDIEDRSSDKAKTIRARILRRLAVFEDVLNERERRFHDLLVKSMKEPLTADEQKELGILEDERLVPTQGMEIRDAKALEKAIEELRAKLRPDNLKL